MKRLILMAMLAGPLLPAQAQLQGPLGGAAIGGILGGVIGHNSGRKTAEGAAIGAGVGLLLGALSFSSRPSYYYYDYASSVAAVPQPVYAYSPWRPSYAATGVALGGLAGGIIGHNSGRHTAEGLAIGAGAGLLLGAVAEQNARPRSYYFQPSPPAYVAASSQITPAPQPVLTAPLVPSLVQVSPPSAMTSANSLFGR